MATGQISEVIQHLRQTVFLPDGAGMTDGQLLSRFIETRDDDAFAALVNRHGAMVWGVCRRLLSSHHDAEDAFQATFLVLVRKAAAVLPREMVANWLYGVACMTAHRGKVAAARARRRERQVVQMPEPAVHEPDLWADMRPLLDQELSRLPDRYRVIVILCDLEGKTRKEAARQLGLREGTVASRLARARAMLAKRLTRHGLTVSVATLAAILSQKAASASVPGSVMTSTIRAATLVAAGQTALARLVSTSVAALTEGVLKAMLLAKLRIAAALVLMFVIMGAGASRLILPTLAAAQAEPDQGRGKDALPKNPVMLKLQGTWVAVAAEANGRQVSEKTLKEAKVTLVISGDQFTATAIMGTNGEVTWSGTIKLDSARKPGQFDVLDGLLKTAKTRSVLKAAGAQGIYELRGDSLKVCYGSERPTQFKTRPDSSEKLYVFERQKPKAEPDQLAFDEALAKEKKFVVVGKVVTADGKTPLAGVEVTASAGMGTLRHTGETKTDKDGLFRLVFRSGLLPIGGAAIIHVRKPGWHGWNYGWPAEFTLSDNPLDKKDVPGRTTNIVPGKPSPLEFRMQPAASLKVKLLDGAGKPLANTRIWLTGKNLPPGCNVIESGTTNADGGFAASDVPRSTYRLVIEDMTAGRGELELGSIHFRDAAEYTAVATIHEWGPRATHVSFKVNRGADR
jgi:RNA polymerase sigma factor (sigma-70 family)